MVGKKKVKFDLNIKIHVLRVWNFAYSESRKGDTWQQFARDRERFKMRIMRQEKDLNVVLAQEHRERIFTQRFIIS
jgi:hypothetical protein